MATIRDGGIRAVLENKVFVSEKMSTSILDAFAGRRSTESTRSVGNHSDRQLDTSQFIGRGRSTKEITDQLPLNVKTDGAYPSSSGRQVALPVGIDRRCFAYAL